jgi:chloramphenicol-sensitive protein RarD
VGRVPDARRGALLGAGAYLLWGLFPLYWPLLEPASALEVLAHRVVWSLLLVAALLLVTRRWTAVTAVVRDRPRLARVALAAVLLSANWFTYIYGVTHDHVVETSLGYFITPLVSVGLGVAVLGERLRRQQWVAVALAALAVVVLSVQNGRPPLIALVLAATFGVYGLLKKTTGVGAVEGLAIETAVVAPAAAAWLAVLALRDDLVLGTQGTAHTALLVGSGLVTAVPLLLFGASATRVSMTTLGLLQYLAPTLQFLCGVVLYDEPLPALRLAGFVLVWVALAVFTADLVRHARRHVVAAEPI